MGRLGLVIADLMPNISGISKIPGRELSGSSILQLRLSMRCRISKKSHADIILVDSRHDEVKTCYDRGLVLLLTESRPEACPAKRHR